MEIISGSTTTIAAGSVVKYTSTNSDCVVLIIDSLGNVVKTLGKNSSFEISTSDDYTIKLEPVSEGCDCVGTITLDSASGAGATDGTAGWSVDANGDPVWVQTVWDEETQTFVNTNTSGDVIVPGTDFFPLPDVEYSSKTVKKCNALGEWCIDYLFKIENDTRTLVDTQYIDPNGTVQADPGDLVDCVAEQVQAEILSGCDDQAETVDVDKRVSIVGTENTIQTIDKTPVILKKESTKFYQDPTVSNQLLVPMAIQSFDFSVPLDENGTGSLYFAYWDNIANAISTNPPIEEVSPHVFLTPSGAAVRSSLNAIDYNADLSEIISSYYDSVLNQPYLRRYNATDFQLIAEYPLTFPSVIDKNTIAGGVDGDNVYHIAVRGGGATADQRIYTIDLNSLPANGSNINVVDTGNDIPFALPDTEAYDLLFSGNEQLVLSSPNTLYLNGVAIANFDLNNKFGGSLSWDFTNGDVILNHTSLISPSVQTGEIWSIPLFLPGTTTVNSAILDPVTLEIDESFVAVVGQISAETLGIDPVTNIIISAVDFGTANIIESACTKLCSTVCLNTCDNSVTELLTSEDGTILYQTDDPLGDNYIDPSGISTDSCLPVEPVEPNISDPYAETVGFCANDGEEYLSGGGMLEIGNTGADAFETSLIRVVTYNLDNNPATINSIIYYAVETATVVNSVGDTVTLNAGDTVIPWPTFVDNNCPPVTDYELTEGACRQVIPTASGVGFSAGDQLTIQSIVNTTTGDFLLDDNGDQVAIVYNSTTGSFVNYTEIDFATQLQSCEDAAPLVHVESVAEIVPTDNLVTVGDGSHSYSYVLLPADGIDPSTIDWAADYGEVNSIRVPLGYQAGYEHEDGIYSGVDLQAFGQTKWVVSREDV